MRHRVFGVFPVDGDIGVVAVGAAGHGDVEVLPRGGGGDDRVRGVGGDALGAVRGDRVAEVQMLGHIVGRQDDPAAEPAPGWADADRPVLANPGDGPAGAVADPGSAVAEPPVVLARDNQIALGDCGAVAQRQFAGGVHGAVDDPIRPRPGVQFGDGSVGLGDQDRRAPGGKIGPPRGVGGVDHRFLVAAGDPALLDQSVDRLGAAVAELE